MMKIRWSTWRYRIFDKLESVVKVAFVVLLVVSLATASTTAGAAEAPMSSQIDGPLVTGNSVEAVISVIAALLRLVLKALLLNMGIGETSVRDHCLRQVFSTASSGPMDVVADFLIGETLVAGIPVHAFLRSISVPPMPIGPGKFAWYASLLRILNFESGKRGEPHMRVDNINHNRPIERSVIVLGMVAGAAICISVALLAIDFFNNAGSFFLHELVLSMSR